MAKKYVEGKAKALKEGQIRVKSGDSLWRLAEKYTGSGANWKQLNGGKELIKPGEIIDIPKNIWNPEVEINGKKLRWRSKEYKEAYNSTTDKKGDIRKAQKQHYTDQAKKGGDASRKATSTFAREAGATVMNAVDMPRRMVAAAANDDYSVKDALQFFGTQDYKSVTGDEYAAKHPYMAAAADIGTGLALWNAPSAIRTIAGTGRSAAKSYAAMAAASDDIARIGSSNAKGMKEGVKAANKAARGTNPKTHDYIKSAVSTGDGPAVNVGGGNTQIASRADRVSKGTGSQSQGSGKWLGQRRPANSGSTGGARQGGGYSGVATYAVPHAPVTPFIPIPIPGMPGGIRPNPTPIPYRRDARIETRTPYQKTTSDLFIENNVARGDTMVMPGGEMIRNMPGADSTWVPRYHDVEARNTYDENADNVTQQNWVPRASDITFQKGQNSVNKYYPTVPENEIRSSQYYPQAIGGNATYKPITYRQKGGKIKSGKKPLRSNFKPTTYEKEKNRLDVKEAALRKQLKDSTLKFGKKNKLKVQLANNAVAKRDLEAWRKTPSKKQAGGVIKADNRNWLNRTQDNILGKWNQGKPQLFKDFPITDLATPALNYITGNTDMGDIQGGMVAPIGVGSLQGIGKQIKAGLKNYYIDSGRKALVKSNKPGATLLDELDVMRKLGRVIVHPTAATAAVGKQIESNINNRKIQERNTTDFIIDKHLRDLIKKD